MAMPTNAMQATLAATVWLRSRWKGMIGSGTRRSQSPKSASNTTAAVSAPSTWKETMGSRARPRRAPAGASSCPAEDARAEPVDVVLLFVGPLRHRCEDHGERHAADGQVHVEDPAPARVVDDEATDQRPDDRRGGEDRADQPLVAAAVARRHDHPDHREGQRKDPARADALDRAEDDELNHVLRRPAERRAEDEDRDRDDEERLAPVDVAEPPVQRHRHRRAEHVGGEDPRVLRDPAELGDDSRQRRRDDRLIEGGEQQRHHQARVDREDSADRIAVSRRGSGEAFAERRHAATASAVVRRALRESRIPPAIASPPTIWIRVMDSDRIRSEKNAARKGCRFANTEARDGPTRLIAPNQSRFASTSGPMIAKTRASQITAPKP